MILFLLSSAVASAQKVTNVRARQEEKKIIITYDLAGGLSGQTFTITLLVSEDGGYSWKGPLQAVSGDAGAGVKAGYSKQLIWDVLAEPGRDKLLGDRIAFKVRAEYRPVSGLCGQPVTWGGKSYQTVKIGTQCWFRENLNIGTRINGRKTQTNNGIIEKYCYGDNEANCNTYGGLYQWAELMQYVSTEGAQGLCPDGWHIPTDAEWSTLTTYLEGELVAGGKMKEAGTSHWASPNTGATNSSGFTALPGGNRSNDGSFYFLAYYAYFWSSSQSAAASAWGRNLLYGSEDVGRDYYTKADGFSCRCLQD
jgi:uncharacterized protein (TIGR02145 family)